jgi:hypothetical protein
MSPVKLLNESVKRPRDSVQGRNHKGAFMSFEITQDGTPILFQQSPAVQSLAKQFNSDYRSKNNVKVRAAWGSLLEQIRRLELKCVDSKGEPVEANPSQTPKDATFVAICRELGIPRSTAYLYMKEYLTISIYPQVVQDAAADAGLNLALDHVQAAYTDMAVTETDLSNPNAVRGIIAQLEVATNPNAKRTTKKTVEQHLISMFMGIFEFTTKNKTESGLIRYCMAQAAKESLNPAGLETWQALVHQLSSDERASRQVAEPTAR